MHFPKVFWHFLSQRRFLTTLIPVLKDRPGGADCVTENFENRQKPKGNDDFRVRLIVFPSNTTRRTAPQQKHTDRTKAMIFRRFLPISASTGDSVTTPRTVHSEPSQKTVKIRKRPKTLGKLTFSSCVTSFWQAPPNGPQRPNKNTRTVPKPWFSLRYSQFLYR